VLVANDSHCLVVARDYRVLPLGGKQGQVAPSGGSGSLETGRCSKPNNNRCGNSSGKGNWVQVDGRMSRLLFVSFQKKMTMRERERMCRTVR
jgi:hypothetical protein